MYGKLIHHTVRHRWNLKNNLTFCGVFCKPAGNICLLSYCQQWNSILVFWNLHSSLVRHIFHPWHAPLPLRCAEPRTLSCVLEKTQPSWRKDDSWLPTHSSVPCKHIIFNSSQGLWSIAFSVHTDFILFHCLSVGFMIFGWNDQTTDCQRAVWCCIFVNISLPVLLLIARYDIPFWIWYFFNGLYFFFFFLLQVL